MGERKSLWRLLDKRTGQERSFATLQAAKDGAALLEAEEKQEAAQKKA